VAIRLWRAGFAVAVSEVAEPLAVRLGVALAAAIWDGRAEVEGLVARKVASARAVGDAWKHKELPVVVDPDAALAKEIEFVAIVDARMTKRGGEGPVPGRPLLIGLGPGFRAGWDCHAVVETRRGHDLGRVYWSGSAEANTGLPDPVAGQEVERVLRAPIAGRLRSVKRIGDTVREGELIARIEHREVRGPFSGVLRGLLHDGVSVAEGTKIGDLDPRGVRDYCFRISDKARAVGGGVLEALLASGQLAPLASMDT
jgi:xanthine dehydrogenase accessory factor